MSACWGEGCGGILILSYISRFSLFFDVQNFALDFFGGRGREGQKNKYVSGMIKL